MFSGINIVKLLWPPVWRGSQWNKSFPQIIGLIKGLKIFLQSVAKMHDVFGIFSDWFRQEFGLPVAS